MSVTPLPEKYFGRVNLEQLPEKIGSRKSVKYRNNRRVPPCAIKTFASRVCTGGGGAAGSRSKPCPRARKAKCWPKETI